MPKYTINGKTYSSPTPLSEDDLMELSGGAPAPAPAEPKAAEPTFLDKLGRQVGLAGRYALEGGEQALTYPVRAVSEAVSGGLNLAGQPEMANAVSRTMGMKGNGGRVVADAIGLPNPEGKLEQAVGGASKMLSGLGVGNVLNKVATEAPAATQAALNAFMPGANSGKEAALYAATGAGLEVAPVETAAALALAMGGKAGASKMLDNRAANKLMKEAGSPAEAAVNAEIMQRIQQEAANTARTVKGDLPPLTAAELNGKVTKSFLREAESAISTLPKDAPGKAELLAGLKRGLSNTQQELEALSQFPGGAEVVDVINKATRAGKMTDQVFTNNSMLGKAARFGITAAPTAIGGAIGGPVGAGIGALLTPLADKWGQRASGKLSRAEVGAQLSSPRMTRATEDVMSRVGPSDAAQSLATIQEMAAKAKASSDAATTARNAFKQERQAADATAEVVTRQRWGEGKTSNGGVQGTISEYTGLKGQDLVDGIEAIAQKYPDLASHLEKVKGNLGVPGVKTLGTIQDELTDWALANGKKVEPSVIRKQAAGFGVDGAKGVPNAVYSRASGIISKMDDGVLSQILSRDASASGEALAKPRAYAASKLAKIMNDKNQGRTLDEEAEGILNLIKDY